MPWRAIIAVLVIVLVIGLYLVLPVAEWIESFRKWAQELGPAGWIVFVLGYAIATTLLVPGSVITLAAGVAYGLWAFPLVIIGATLGAGMAFLLARYAFYDRVQKAIEDYPKFRAVDAAIAEEGWKVVGLLRLSPALPFSLQNWFLGTTSVGFVPSMIATFFGIMPGTLLYVWLGSLGGQAAAGSGSTLKYFLFAVGIIATLVVTWIVGKKAREKLAEHGLEEAG